jgi:hypothetical protein
MLKGNEDRVQGMSLASILEAHATWFAKPSTTNIVFSQENTINEGSAIGTEPKPAKERPLKLIISAIAMSPSKPATPDSGVSASLRLP